MSRTYRLGSGTENSVASTQSSVRRRLGGWFARTTPHSRSQRSIATMPPGRSDVAIATRAASTSEAVSR
jgi:hypothetical protein